MSYAVREGLLEENTDLLDAVKRVYEEGVDCLLHVDKRDYSFWRNHVYRVMYATTIFPEECEGKYAFLHGKVKFSFTPEGIVLKRKKVPIEKKTMKPEYGPAYDPDKFDKAKAEVEEMFEELRQQEEIEEAPKKEKPSIADILKKHSEDKKDSA
jgi:hypothetical protein